MPTSLILTLAAASAGWLAAAAAWTHILQTRRKPYLLVYLDPNGCYLDLVIRNDGSGLALDLTVKVEQGANQLLASFAEGALLRDGISPVIPGVEQRHQCVSLSGAFWGDGPRSPVPLLVRTCHREHGLLRLRQRSKLWELPLSQFGDELRTISVAAVDL